MHAPNHKVRKQEKNSLDFGQREKLMNQLFREKNTLGKDSPIEKPLRRNS